VLLGYAPVSAAEQNADLQTDELTSAGCYEVFVGHASGVLDRRPQLEEVLKRARGTPCRCGAWTGSASPCNHLIGTVTALDERGVGSGSLRESIDIITAGGRVVFTCSVLWPQHDRLGQPSARQLTDA